MLFVCFVFYFFFFQAEDGIRDLVRSRGLGDVYKRQIIPFASLVLYVCPPDCVIISRNSLDASPGVVIAYALSLIHI